MDELKPCPNPWCDRPNGLRVSLIDDEWRVHCRCNLVGPGEKGNTRGQAIEEWNNRTAPDDVVEAKFQMGDKVTKISGSNWTGRVVGTYSTALTPEGYAVESAFEKGSVQIYPAKALRHFYSEAARKAALQARPDGALVGELEPLIKECNRLQPLSIEHECACDELADFVLCQQNRILTALRSNHDDVVEFAKAVLHGDEEHQAWLTEAAECWVAGKPLPKPRNLKESSNV